MMCIRRRMESKEVCMCRFSEHLFRLSSWDRLQENDCLVFQRKMGENVQEFDSQRKRFSEAKTSDLYRVRVKSGNTQAYLA